MPIGIDINTGEPILVPAGAKGDNGYVLDPTKVRPDITALNQPLVDPVANPGAWQISTLSGTLSGTNSGSIAVTQGQAVISNGTAYVAVTLQGLASDEQARIGTLATAAVTPKQLGIAIEQPSNQQKFDRAAWSRVMGLDESAPLRWLRNAQFGVTTGLNTPTGLGNPLTVVLYGDSVGREQWNAYSDLWREWNWRGVNVVHTGNPQSGAGFGTLTGGAAALSSEFTLFPTGLVVAVPAAGTYTVSFSGPTGTNPTNNATNTQGQARYTNSASVIYSVGPGQGTFKIQYRIASGPATTLTQAWIDAPGFENVDASAGSVSAAVAVVPTSPKGFGTQIRIVGLTGTVNIITMVGVDTDSNGLTIIDFTRGGLNLQTQANLCPKVVMDVVLQHLKPSLVSLNIKDDLVADEQNFADMLTQWSGWSQKDWSFVISTPSRLSTSTEVLEWSRRQRQFAISRGFHVFDGAAWTRTWQDSMAPEVAQSITSISRSGGTATATTAAPHGLRGSTDIVVISGANESQFNMPNGTAITVTSTTQFTYSVANSGPTSATGTLLVTRLLGIFRDDTHFTIKGEWLMSRAYLRSIGMLDNQLAAESRIVNSPIVTGVTDVRFGPQYRSESLSTRAIADRKNAWVGTRGLTQRTGDCRIANLSPLFTPIGTAAFSISAFFEVPTGVTFSPLGILSSVNANSNVASSFSVAMLTFERFRVTLRNPAANYTRSRDYYVTDASAIPSDSINMMTLTRSGKDLRVFLNGRELYTSNPSGNDTVGDVEFDGPIDNTYLVFEGGVGGTLYGWGLFPTALSEAAIMRMWETGEPPSGATAYYRFNEQSGSLVYDDARLYPLSLLISDGAQSPVANWSQWTNPSPNRGVDLVITSGVTAKLNEAYLATRASGLTTVTLPNPATTTVRVGDFVTMQGSGVGGWRIAQPALQQIVIGAGGTVGTNATTIGTGGHLSSTQRYDVATFRYLGSNRWGVQSAATLAWV